MGVTTEPGLKEAPGTGCAEGYCAHSLVSCPTHLQRAASTVLCCTGGQAREAILTSFLPPGQQGSRAGIYLSGLPAPGVDGGAASSVQPCPSPLHSGTGHPLLPPHLPVPPHPLPPFFVLPHLHGSFGGRVLGLSLPPASSLPRAPCRWISASGRLGPSCALQLPTGCSTQVAVWTDQIASRAHLHLSLSPVTGSDTLLPPWPQKHKSDPPTTPCRPRPRPKCPRALHTGILKHMPGALRHGFLLRLMITS